MSSCVTCDVDSTNAVVLTSLRCLGKMLFVKMCTGCYKKSSVKFKVCNFCGAPEDDMYVVHNDNEYHRIRCCAACVTNMREKIGLKSRSIVNELVEADDEAK